MTPEELAEIKTKYKEAKKRYSAYVMTCNTGLMNTAILKSEFIKGKNCSRCGRSKNITYDHIIPVQILNSFGIDDKKEYWEDNGQALCHACNIMKANRLDFSIPKTKQLLNNLLETI